jgi:NAD-dependent DNA ligase
MAVRLTNVSELELGEKTIEKLQEAGLNTVQELANMSEEQLREIPGIGEKTAEKVRAAALRFLEEADQRRIQRAEGTEEAEAAAEGEQTASEVAEEKPASQESKTSRRRLKQADSHQEPAEEAEPADKARTSAVNETESSESGLQEVAVAEETHEQGENAASSEPDRASLKDKGE